MSNNIIKAFKENVLIDVELPRWQVFKKPGTYTRLPKERIIGLDTENFENVNHGSIWDQDTQRFSGGLRTNLIPLDFADPSHNVVLETAEYEYPFEAVLDYLWSLYAEREIKASWTKQRPRKERTSGVNKGDTYRDGRRQHIQPVVVVMHNADYDIGRLFRNHPQFRRVVLSCEESQRIQIGKYEIEIAHIRPDGSAPSFEFYVRYNHEVMRLIGRDTWGYLKSSLDKAASDMLGTVHKMDIDKEWFNRNWESFSPDEEELIIKYAAHDAYITRQVYEMLIELLTSIDEKVICQNGLPPASAPGATAKMAFAMAGVDEWYRPSRKVMQQGAYAYAGARSFSRRWSAVQNVYIRDVSSAYPHVMTLLPDPSTCQYVDIEPGIYDHEQWKGQFGVMFVSGRGLDPHYPALRTHDTNHKRLVYIYGEFSNIPVTIPEIVIGVESGRLEITHIHKGIHMQGSAENSFLRRYVLRLYELKVTSPKNSAMYLLAKLLLNALYGKLLEVSIDHPSIEKQAYAVQVPPYPGVEQDEKAYDRLFNAYIENGSDGVEDIAYELFQAHEDEVSETKEVFFGELVNRHRPNVGKAGAYYLPMHGAQITGFVSAKLGLAAHCTNAIQGDTDSLFTIGRQDQGYAAYHEIMQRAGYDAPLSGLGSFELEVEKASGYVVKNKLYALKYYVPSRTIAEKLVKSGSYTNLKSAQRQVQRVRKYPGRPLTLAMLGKLQRAGVVVEDIYQKEKIANHGIIHVEHESLYNRIVLVAKSGLIAYKTKPTPKSLRESLHRQIEPGIFASESHMLKIEIDPNMEWNEHGERVWKPFVQPAWIREELDALSRARQRYAEKQQPIEEQPRMSIHAQQQETPTEETVTATTTVPAAPAGTPLCPVCHTAEHILQDIRRGTYYCGKHPAAIAIALLSGHTLQCSA